MAQRNPLKDRYGHIIGYVDVDGNGKKTLKDKYGHILGYYEPRSNATKDKYGHIVGYGDILTTLLI